jgi:protein tyrosine phosphatase (PTP) superfamily phosphohydrolase (DUF442 family)
MLNIKAANINKIQRDELETFKNLFGQAQSKGTSYLQSGNRSKTTSKKQIEIKKPDMQINEGGLLHRIA